jgi:hypothetical protein
MTAQWRLLVTTLASFLVYAAPASAAECLDVFDPFQVLTLNLSLTEQNWDTIRKDTTFEIEVPARFWADGEDPNGILVSVRRKRGKAIPSESNPQKFPLKIDINELVDGQKWRDLVKLSLENGGGSFGTPWKAGDLNVVEEGMAWVIHRLASRVDGYDYVIDDDTPLASAAACAAWVRLNVNGVYRGVYLSAEQRDKQMLRNRELWTSGSTWFYEQEVGGTLIEEGDGDSPTVTHLCYAPFRPKRSATCPTPSDPALKTDLNDWVNMKGLLAACAADAIADNGDGLCTHGQNIFFVDFDPGQVSDPSGTGRARMYFPWDLDSVFPPRTDGGIYGQISRKGVTQTPYQSIILNHQGFRQQYNAMLTNLTNGPLSAVNLNAFLDSLEGGALPTALAADPYPTVTGDIGDYFDRFRAWITQRIANVQSQVTANNTPAPRP